MKPPGSPASDGAQQSFRIASPQRGCWTYAKDDSLTSGADTAWLDEVVFVPDPVAMFSPQRFVRAITP